MPHSQGRLKRDQVHLAAQFGKYLRHLSEDGEWLPDESGGSLRDPLIPVHSDVLKAARSYRQAQRVDDLIGYMKPGICRGLCTVKAACCLAGNDELYESLLVEISLWDGAQRSLSDVVSVSDREITLHKLLGEFLDLTIYTQNTRFLCAPTFKLKQEYAGQIHASKPSMMVAGYFTEDDFEIFLNRFERDGLIILTDAKHMCTLQKVISNKVTMYYFYDPREPLGEKVFTNTHLLYSHIDLHKVLSRGLVMQFISDTQDSLVPLKKEYDERTHHGWLDGPGMRVLSYYRPDKFQCLLDKETSDQINPLITALRYVRPLLAAYNAPVDLAKIIESKELQQAVKAFILYREKQVGRRKLSEHGQRQVETFFQNCLRERILTRDVMRRHANAARKGGFFSRRSGGGPGSRDEVFGKLGILSQ